MSIKEELMKESQRIKDNAGIGQVSTLINLEQFEWVRKMYGEQEADRLVEEGKLYIVETSMKPSQKTVSEHYKKIRKDYELQKSVTDAEDGNLYLVTKRKLNPSDTFFIGNSIEYAFKGLRLKPRTINLLQAETLQDIIMDFFDDDGEGRVALTFSKGMWYRAEIGRFVNADKNGSATYKLILAGEGYTYALAVLGLAMAGIAEDIFDYKTVKEIRRVLRGKLTDFEGHRLYIPKNELTS